MSIGTLALDLGTTTGWAWRAAANGGKLGFTASGIWSLRGGRYEGGGMRFLRLHNYLEAFLKTNPFGVIYFEEVRRHLGTDAAHIYGGCLATVATFCERNKIAYQGIPVGTIKKHATGKGNADKKAMFQAACSKWPHEIIEDDNQADALWILDTGISETL